MSTRKFFWFILAICVLSACATLWQLVTVYLMSLVEVPHAYQYLNQDIARATDIDSLKAACLSLTQLDESDRQGRIKLMVLSPFIALLTSVVCAVLSAWALIASRKTTQATSS